MDDVLLAQREPVTPKVQRFRWSAGFDLGSLIDARRLVEPPRYAGRPDRGRRGEPHRWGLGLQPADFTVTIEGREGTLLADCWCGHNVVRVPELWPSLGRTGVCDWEHCGPERALTRVRRSFRARTG